MNVFLMHRHHDFQPQEIGDSLHDDLFRDLELDILLHTMSGKDKLIDQVVRSAFCQCALNDEETVIYRQDVFKDCLAHEKSVRMLYDLALTPLKWRHAYYGTLYRTPSGCLYGAVERMKEFLQLFKQIRQESRLHAKVFGSEGFRQFWNMIDTVFTDDFLGTISQHLQRLQSHETVMAMKLGEDNGALNVSLLVAPKKKKSWYKRLFASRKNASTFYIHERDHVGHQILSALTNSGISRVSDVLLDSTEQISRFLTCLRTELAFYVGCLNLHTALDEIGTELSFPVIKELGSGPIRFLQLINPSLAMVKKPEKTVGNTLKADGKNLVIITGANQGGKTVFLRSLGLAQLMMQTGMFVSAASYEGTLCSGLFSHFRREEDSAMKSGKLVEELERLSRIVEKIKPDSMLLCNESFASTYEHEASWLTGQIVKVLLEKRIRVYLVTHLTEFVENSFKTSSQDVLFLQAERHQDGYRSFRMVEGVPLASSNAVDVYKDVFEPTYL